MKRCIEKYVKNTSNAPVLTKNEAAYLKEGISKIQLAKPRRILTEGDQFHSNLRNEYRAVIQNVWNTLPLHDAFSNPYLYETIDGVSHNEVVSYVVNSFHKWLFCEAPDTICYSRNPEYNFSIPTKQSFLQEFKTLLYEKKRYNVQVANGKPPRAKGKDSLSSTPISSICDGTASVVSSTTSSLVNTNSMTEAFSTALRGEEYSR